MRKLFGSLVFGISLLTLVGLMLFSVGVSILSTLITFLAPIGIVILGLIVVYILLSSLFLD